MSIKAHRESMSRPRCVADHFNRTGPNFGCCRHCKKKIAWNALALSGHLHRNAECLKIRQSTPTEST